MPSVIVLNMRNIKALNTAFHFAYAHLRYELIAVVFVKDLPIDTHIAI